MWQLVAQFYEGRHSKLVAKTRHGKWVISGLALRLNLRIDQLYVSTPAAFLPQKNLKETENSHPKYNLHFLCQMNCIISLELLRYCLYTSAKCQLLSVRLSTCCILRHPPSPGCCNALIARL